jgi:diacylglycerol kinase family enzyme
MALPVCVIVNVSAHSDGAAHVELGRLFKAAGIQIEIKLTKSAKNVLEEVSAAILREPSTIIVGGGDGTLNACPPRS